MSDAAGVGVVVEPLMRSVIVDGIRVAVTPRDLDYVSVVFGTRADPQTVNRVPVYGNGPLHLRLVGASDGRSRVQSWVVDSASFYCARTGSGEVSWTTKSRIMSACVEAVAQVARETPALFDEARRRATVEQVARIDRAIEEAEEALNALRETREATAVRDLLPAAAWIELREAHGRETRSSRGRARPDAAELGAETQQALREVSACAGTVDGDAWLAAARID